MKTRQQTLKAARKWEKSPREFQERRWAGGGGDVSRVGLQRELGVGHTGRMKTTKNVHGHEVMRMVGAAGAALTRGELEAEMVRRFGAEARFCTCSASDMTREELLGFLLARGKLVEREGRLGIERSRICEG